MCSASTLSEHLKRWSDSLRVISDSAKLDADILFKHASGLDDVRLIINGHKPLSTTLIAKTQALISKRAEGTPIAYIVGQREFYSLVFKVNKHVLIPRPETELLVEAAHEYINNNSVKNVLDLGTGSGAIAISLAKHHPNIRFTATDKSLKALEVAMHNAKAQKTHNVIFQQSDWFSKLSNKQFDLILSNPPYIDPTDTHLKRGDVRFEPISALVANDLGLADLKHIIRAAQSHLSASGRIMLEHGFDQKPPVQEILSQHSFTNIDTIKDYSGHDRVSIGRLIARP